MISDSAYISTICHKISNKIQLITLIESRISPQQAACVFLHLILHYFLLTNYAWMLCEGFYLHTVLVSAFVSEKKLVKWLMLLGWGSPFLVLFVYGFARGFRGDVKDKLQ